MCKCRALLILTSLCCRYGRNQPGELTAPSKYTYCVPGTMLSEHFQHTMSLHPCNSLVEGPSPHFSEGKLRLKEVKQSVRGHKAGEMDRALQTLTGSLGRREDGQAGGPQPSPRLNPGRADPKYTPFRHSRQRALRQRQSSKGGNSCCWEQNPRPLGRQGRGWAPSWAPLSVSLVALGK